MPTSDSKPSPDEVKSAEAQDSGLRPSDTQPGVLSPPAELFAIAFDNDGSLFSAWDGSTWTTYGEAEKQMHAECDEPARVVRYVLSANATSHEPTDVPAKNIEESADKKAIDKLRTALGKILKTEHAGISHRISHFHVLDLAREALQGSDHTCPRCAELCTCPNAPWDCIHDCAAVPDNFKAGQ